MDHAVEDWRGHLAAISLVIRQSPVRGSDVIPRYLPDQSAGDLLRNLRAHTVEESASVTHCG